MSSRPSFRKREEAPWFEVSKDSLVLDFCVKVTGELKCKPLDLFYQRKKLEKHPQEQSNFVLEVQKSAVGDRKIFHNLTL